MNITTAVYLFDIDEVIVKVPFEIVKETKLCYFTNNGRYMKTKMNKPILKSATNYPYVEIHMVDADEVTLRNELSNWFTDKAMEIKR